MRDPERENRQEKENLSRVFSIVLHSMLKTSKLHGPPEFLIILPKNNCENTLCASFQDTAIWAFR